MILPLVPGSRSEVNSAARPGTGPGCSMAARASRMMQILSAVSGAGGRAACASSDRRSIPRKARSGTCRTGPVVGAGRC